MTWDNGRITSRFDLPLDAAVPRFRRVLARLRRQPAEPWAWERLATPEEIARLRQTDLRRAA